jgi:hypothetical protein
MTQKGFLNQIYPQIGENESSLQFVTFVHIRGSAEASPSRLLKKESLKSASKAALPNECLLPNESEGCPTNQFREMKAATI